MLISKINVCRSCKSNKLIDLFSLGLQSLTGVFPKRDASHPKKAPLELVLCKVCGLVQLKHSFELNILYGETYGYRSGLNNSMKIHLNDTAQKLTKICDLSKEDTICDIGCNDGTLLSCFNIEGLNKIGIDPLAKKFSNYHEEDIKIASGFFSKKLYNNISSKKSKLVTSISMFYDLEDPVIFARDVHDILSEDGLWYFEQSYLPLMLKNNSFDTICHEHLEYYSINSIKFILEEANLKIIDISFNEINGGSFSITASKITSRHKENTKVKKLIEHENSLNLYNYETYISFKNNYDKLGKKLLDTINKIHDENKVIAGYGASTKGNVLLQYYGIDRSILPFILEINEDKRNKVTPGSNIPILLEDEVNLNKIDYLLVLPWHFRNNIIEKEKKFLENGGKFIFPLPNIEIFSKNNIIK